MALVVLVGLPGSGKTTAGRALAQAVGTAFVDTDAVFLDLEGVSVQDFLRAHDESEFRERELLALHHALSSSAVVATGGGVVTTETARRLLEHELTVWLDCPDAVLVTRVSDGDRPLLGEDPSSRLIELRERRDPWYDEVSRIRVDSSQPLDQLVTQLLDVVAKDRADR